MKIYYERSGGFIGRNVSTVVDTNQLPPEEALGLLEKVDTADFFSIPESFTSGLESVHGADRLCYKVTVEVAGVRHTVEASDENLPEELQPLIQELTQFARESARTSSDTLAPRSGDRR